MTAFTNDYYKFMLMNEDTLISPVLGIFTINLSGDSDQIEPINFMLMKSVIPSNIPNIESMNTMLFDLKGSTYGRRAIKDKENLTKLYCLEKSVLNSPLKDCDFNEGMKSLELSKTHPEKWKLLLDQISKDTALFKKHNLMDYSLLIFIVYDLSWKYKLPIQKYPHSFVQENIQVEWDGKILHMNRYIWFGIIDYLTNFNLFKVIEEKIKNTYQHNPSAVHPDLYMARFVTQCKKVLFWEEEEQK